MTKRKPAARKVITLNDDISDEELKAFADSLSEDERNALLDLALVSLAQQDTPQGFSAFFQFMHGTPLHAEGRKWVANAYAAHDKKMGLLQQCHRESGKTTVFSKFFFAFKIGHNPELVNAIIRINDDKANETAAAVANIIANDLRWKMVFPNVVPDEAHGWGESGYEVRRTDVSDEEWAKIKTQSPDGPTFVGRGWKSGSIIGSRFNGIVIVDDIHDEGNTSSERQLAAVKKWYTDTFKFCVMAGAWEIWNYTPWLENDLYAYLETTGEYMLSKSPVMIPAQEGEKGATYWEPAPLNLNEPDAGTIPISGRWYKLYWPEWWGYERIASYYRTTGAVGFARMMLLDLQATRGLTLKKEWLHYYPADQIDPSWPVFFGIDYASTADKLRDKERDYFTLAIMRAVPGGGLVLVDGYAGRISKGEALQKTVSLASIYPTLQLIGVERLGKGEEFYNDLVFADDAFGKVLPLIPIQHGRKSKGDRFEDWLAPRFQMARIWVSNAETPFLNDFISQWLLWPNVAHDDHLDGVYMAAVAGEGHIPTTERRTHGVKKEKKPNPYAALANA